MIALLGRFHMRLSGRTRVWHSAHSAPFLPSYGPRRAGASLSAPVHPPPSLPARAARQLARIMNLLALNDDVLTNIGHSKGNAIPIMAQKSLCGHSKGGSAAWQLAGLLQSVESAIVPGNRNAE